MSKIYNQAISTQMQELLSSMSGLAIGPLTGGTALALQIGHRISYDLDFVTTEKITNSKIDQLMNHFQDQKIVQQLRDETQYTAFIDDIKLTLFQDKAPLLHPTVQHEEVALVSIQDIFSTKLYILSKRAVWRDYCDIALIIDNGLANLKQGIKEATSRYQISQRWILEPLTYFKDVESMPIEWIDKSYSDSDIHEILISASDNYLSI